MEPIDSLLSRYLLQSDDGWAENTFLGDPSETFGSMLMDCTDDCCFPCCLGGFIVTLPFFYMFR